MTKNNDNSENLEAIRNYSLGCTIHGGRGLLWTDFGKRFSGAIKYFNTIWL